MYYISSAHTYNDCLYEMSSTSCVRTNMQQVFNYHVASAYDTTYTHAITYS